MFCWFLLTIPVLYFSLFVPFETDTGDSVVHYFFARYAFQNPMLFLDHWAKPFFTLLASPFAQFGFSGMKLFNGLAGLLSAWLAYCIARKLDLKFAWLAIIFVLFSPLHILLNFFQDIRNLFSGLMLIASVYLVVIQTACTGSIPDFFFAICTVRRAYYDHGFCLVFPDPKEFQGNRLIGIRTYYLFLCRVVCR